MWRDAYVTLEIKSCIWKMMHRNLIEISIYVWLRFWNRKYLKAYWSEYVLLTSWWRFRSHRSLRCRRWRRNPLHSYKDVVHRWRRWSISGSQQGSGRSGSHLQTHPELPGIWNRGMLQSLKLGVCQSVLWLNPLNLAVTIFTTYFNNK